MSNIWKREPFRHHSYVSRAATGVIAGAWRARLRAGADGRLAVDRGADSSMTSKLMAFYSAHDDFNAWRAAACRPRTSNCARPMISWKSARVRARWSGSRRMASSHAFPISVSSSISALASMHWSGGPACLMCRSRALSDPKMARMMAGYVLFAVLRHARRHFRRSNGRSAGGAGTTSIRAIPRDDQRRRARSWRGSA